MAAAPVEPTSQTELIVPAEKTTLPFGEQFLYGDTGAGKERMLVFTTNTNMELLAKCPHWFGDGTFKTVSPMFCQLYTLHGLIGDSTVPLVQRWANYGARAACGPRKVFMRPAGSFLGVQPLDKTPAANQPHRNS